MATYKKTLKTLTIKTVGGTTITVADTADKNAASNALAAFDDYKTMYIETKDGVTLVPFHAVDNIVVTTAQSGDIQKADPYGCD